MSCHIVKVSKVEIGQDSIMSFAHVRIHPRRYQNKSIAQILAVAQVLAKEKVQREIAVTNSATL